MEIKNNSKVSILIEINGEELRLNPSETWNIAKTGRVKLCLRHTYSSSSMTIDDMVFDFHNDSIDSLVNLSSSIPYFNVVLDSEYVICVSEDSVIEIQRQLLRPTYSCSYDRLFPVCNKSNIISEKYSFLEKERFIATYITASKKAHKFINFSKILLKILLFSCIPVIALAVAFMGILGFVGIIGFATVMIPLSIFYLISKAGIEWDVKNTIEDFQSEKIADYFKKEIASSNSRICIK